MSVPEIRWCEDSGMVLRRADDDTWTVLDTVGDADEAAVSASIRLLPQRQLWDEAAELRAAFRESNRTRGRLARERAARTRTAVGAFMGAFGAVAAGVALCRWL